MAQNKDQKRPPGRRRRTLGLIVASAVATAPLGCDDSTNPSVDAGLTMEAPDAGASPDAGDTEDALAMDTMATSDGASDAGDAAQEYPAGVRG